MQQLFIQVAFHTHRNLLTDPSVQIRRAVIAQALQQTAVFDFLVVKVFVTFAVIVVDLRVNMTRLLRQFRIVQRVFRAHAAEELETPEMRRFVLFAQPTDKLRVQKAFIRHKVAADEKLFRNQLCRVFVHYSAGGKHLPIAGHKREFIVPRQPLFDVFRFIGDDEFVQIQKSDPVRFVRVRFDAVLIRARLTERNGPVDQRYKAFVDIGL